MNFGWKPVAWSAAALLLLLSIASPLNAFTIFLLMTPLVVLFVMLRPIVFAAHVAVIAVAAFLLAGGAGPIVLTLGFFFLVPSIVMGYIYKKGYSAKTAVLFGFGIILAQLLVEFAIFSFRFDLDLSAELAAMLKESFVQLETAASMPAGWGEDLATGFGDMVVRLLPLLLLMSSFLLAIVTHGLSRRALRASGTDVPGLPQAKTWRLPRSLVWYYLIALIASYAISADSDGYWAVAFDNLVPILQYAFAIQAIGFFFFLADAKKWPNVVPALIAIPLVLFAQPLYLIGLIDIAFPLRKYFVK